MAKFTTGTEGLTAFSVGSKKIRANKDGQFDLTPEQENVIRASGHTLTLVESKPDATTTAPAPVASTKKGAKAEPEATAAPAPDAPESDQNPPAAPEA
jgi:hypothetical protein